MRRQRVTQATSKVTGNAAGSAIHELHLPLQETSTTYRAATRWPKHEAVTLTVRVTRPRLDLRSLSYRPPQVAQE